MNRRRFAGAAALALASACQAVGPDYETPAASPPERWREQDAQFTSGTDDLQDWWRRLEDPVLDGLVERATRFGLDAREALARVRESRALRGVSRAGRYPTLDANLSYSRRGESENTQFGGFLHDTDMYSAGFDAAWEVDLWGRVRRSVEAADADLAASLEDARDVFLSVAAETAINYVELRAFQKRVEIALTNVSLQEQTLALVRGRFEAGLVGERDVAQAATNVESTRSRVPPLRMGVRAAENRLAVLLGLAPGALAAELTPARPLPVPPITVAVGVPADLLRRRADVRRAERVLAAETARIGVAEADLYPRLALNGSLGLASEDASDFFDSDSNFFSIGPSIRWNLFDAGRRKFQVEAQDARAEVARVQWERAVLVGLEETENAMSAFLNEQLRKQSLSEAVVQARSAVELARSQYREGLSDFQAVLDSEREMAGLEDELAQCDAAVTTGVIVLYKALGGGFGRGEDRAIAGAP